MAVFAKSWRQFSWTISAGANAFYTRAASRCPAQRPSQQYAMGLKCRRVRLHALRSAPRP